jgi:hydrogenase small subunit
MRLETARVLVQKATAAIRQNKIKKGNLIWLELTGCSGNIISLLDGSDPNFKTLATQMVNLVYDNSLMAAEGEAAMEKLFGVIGRDYILAVEGAVATKNNGSYNVIGRWRGRPVTALDAVKKLGEKAAYVIAVGTCASSGGISAARPNPAACVPVQTLLSKKVIRLPGCPCHPDWFLGTLGYILLFGEPALDSGNRPLMFYSTLIHDICPRRPFFDQGIFHLSSAKRPACSSWGAGAVTRVTADPEVEHRVNWPFGDNTRCIGCACWLPAGWNRCQLCTTRRSD